MHLKNCWFVAEYSSCLPDLTVSPFQSSSDSSLSQFDPQLSLHVVTLMTELMRQTLDQLNVVQMCEILLLLV